MKFVNTSMRHNLSLCGSRVYCAVCINFANKLREFDTRLRAIETSLVQNSVQTYAAAVIGTKSAPTEH